MIPYNPVYISIVGLLIVIVGIISQSLIFPKLEQHLIDKATAMIEGGEMFEMWKSPPFPFKLKVYFFNITNMEQLRNGEKPKFKEIGPFIYDEFRQRQILAIEESNDTIRYNQKKVYYFNRDDSKCRDEDDVVTILNFVIVATANKVNNMAPPVLPLLNSNLPYLFPNNRNLFLTAPVRDILFNGLLIACESPQVEMICNFLQSQLPPIIRFADNHRDYLLSIFYHLNNTNDGSYEITRGIKNTIKGNIVAYQDVTTFTQWQDEFCNRIQGTDLTLNPPLINRKNYKIQLFARDLCRTLLIEFDKSVKLSDLDVYQFKMKTTFGELPQEKCFCPMKDGTVECPPLGTMDIDKCTEVPILISQPHFFGAPSLLKYADGLEPSEDKHNTFIKIEPKTGISVSVKIRLQMNIELVRIAEVDLLRNVSEGILPFLWFETGVELPEEIIGRIRRNFDKLRVFVIVKNVLIGSGISLTGIALILGMFKDRIACFKQFKRNSVDIDGGRRETRTITRDFPHNIPFNK